MLRRLQRLSLRQKLPLFVSALAVGVLLVTVGVAHQEVRRAARAVTLERIDRTVAELASLVASSAVGRDRLKTEVAAEPALLAALRGQPIDTVALMESLQALRQSADSGLPVQLWSPGGDVLLSDIEVPAIGWDPLADPHPPLDTVPTYGRFHIDGGVVLYWSTAPVRQGDAIRGWVVQRRRLGNPQTAAQFERLLGSDVRIFFAYRGDSLWVTLAGEPVTAPMGWLPVDTTVSFAGPRGEAVLAKAEAIDGTPWAVLVQVPRSALLARPMAFLRRMGLLGALLTLITVAAAWMLSRRLTDPLGELAEASGAVARGDYEWRVPERGEDEVARLARAFNSMAETVAASREVLEQRLAEAQSLARELEEANREAMEARESAQAANRAKSEFLATMSHEVRTPINAVLGFCDLLELEIVDRPALTRQEYVERIRRAARTLAALVDDVLDFAKIESGRMRVIREAASVQEAIDGASALVGLEIDRKKQTFAVECPEHLSYVGDPRRVEQILTNLLSNAVKFTPEGGRIRVRAEEMNGAGGPSAAASMSHWVRIAVEDSGIGIPDEHRKRVFDPFVQADAGYGRRFGGTGLGLSISRRLAVMMGGDVTVESEPERGSRFSLWLPAAAERESSAAVGTG